MFKPESFNKRHKENVLFIIQFQFQAWNVLQTHIEYNRTVRSHPWPSWCWVQAFGECQLLKATAKCVTNIVFSNQLNNIFFFFFFMFVFVNTISCLIVWTISEKSSYCSWNVESTLPSSFHAQNTFIKSFDHLFYSLRLNILKIELYIQNVSQTFCFIKQSHLMIFSN